MTYRFRLNEIDNARFIRSSNSAIGAMVVKSPKGKYWYAQSEQDILDVFGTPSATYPDLFDAIAFVKTSPLHIFSAIGEGALYGGLDVRTEDVIPFGVGRDFDTFTFATIGRKSIDESTGTGDGHTATFAKTLAHVGIVEDSISLTVNGLDKNISETGGVVSGTGITGTLDKTTGALSLTFSGTAGTKANVTSNVDLSANVDLSSGGDNKLIKLIIDSVIYDNINLGNSATTTRASIISAINTAVGSTVAVAEGTEYIKITGTLYSIHGNITIDAPSNGASALTLVFYSGGTALTANGTNPTGVIPKTGEPMTVSYQYSDSEVNKISHSIFTISPYVDDLAGQITYISGSKYKLDLYKLTTLGNVYKESYTYSLLREKDNFGASLYYEDVFKDTKWVQIKVNSNYTDVANPLNNSPVAFTGGVRGSAPQQSHYLQAWNNFRNKNKYKAYIFMDVVGNSASYIVDIITNYQRHAKGGGITTVPFGSSAVNSAISIRKGLGINSDVIALKCCWRKIKDDYNNSEAWVSDVGSWGAKFARPQMATFDYSKSVGGTDEGGCGGEIDNWVTIELENYYTDADTGSELQTLDENQINPTILDQDTGVTMVFGDKTLLNYLTDTSFIGTRRTFANIQELHERYLKSQSFKWIDQEHYDKARIPLQDDIDRRIANGSINDGYVICSDQNNTGATKQRREFIVDVYVQATANSQFVIYNFTRVGQNISVQESIAQA